jgi:predicted transcriptional regulator
MQEKYRESLIVLSHLEDGCCPDLNKLCEKTCFDSKKVRASLKFLKNSGLIFDNGLVVKLMVRKIGASQF